MIFLKVKRPFSSINWTKC